MFKFTRFWMISGVIAVAPLLALRADDKSDEKKGVVVEIDDLKSMAPANWKSEEVTTKFRTHHFRIPHVADDKTDAELTIFFFGAGSGGSADANIKRWKCMFLSPAGKNIDGLAKGEGFKVGKVSTAYADVQGTYNFKERAFDP